MKFLSLLFASVSENLSLGLLNLDARGCLSWIFLEVQ